MEFSGIAGKPGSQEIDQDAGPENADDRDGKQRETQPAEDVGEKISGLLCLAFPHVLIENGNKGLRKCPLAKESSKQIGNALGYEEGVSGHPGAKQVCEHDVADKAEEAGQKSIACHPDDIAEQVVHRRKNPARSRTKLR